MTGLAPLTRRHVANRVLSLVVTTFVASVIIFVIMRTLPGDVVGWILSGGGEAVHSPEVREALRTELGLNDPFVVQYLRWAYSMLTGGFGGKSLASGQPITDMIARQFPVTLLLAFYASVLSVIIAVPFAAVSALRWNRWPDYLIRLITIPGQAIPNFLLALLLLLGLVLLIGWSPPIIYTNPWENPLNHFQIMILPVLFLSWESSSHVARVARAHILEALNEDYIFTARAKGLREQKVVLSHALRNALVPTVTILGLQFGTLLGGTLILESIFGLPGLGRGLVQAALVRDFPVIQTLVTVLVFLILTLNLMIDLAYGILDPRIHFSHTGHALYSRDARRGATVR